MLICIFCCLFLCLECYYSRYSLKLSTFAFLSPQDNPSEKDINQGTIVLFNVDLSLTNDDLHKIFGDYGEIKEVRYFIC